MRPSAAGRVGRQRGRLVELYSYFVQQRQRPEAPQPDVTTPVDVAGCPTVLPRAEFGTKRSQVQILSPRPQQKCLVNPWLDRADGQGVVVVEAISGHSRGRRACVVRRRTGCCDGPARPLQRSGADSGLQAETSAARTRGCEGSACTQNESATAGSCTIHRCPSPSNIATRAPAGSNTPRTSLTHVLIRSGPGHGEGDDGRTADVVADEVDRCADGLQLGDEPRAVGAHRAVEPVRYRRTETRRWETGWTSEGSASRAAMTSSSTAARFRTCGATRVGCRPGRGRSGSRWCRHRHHPTMF